MLHNISNLLSLFNIFLFIVGLLLVFRSGMLKRLGLFCLFLSTSCVQIARFPAWKTAFRLLP